MGLDAKHDSVSINISNFRKMSKEVVTFICTASLLNRPKLGTLTANPTLSQKRCKS